MSAAYDGFEILFKVYKCNSVARHQLNHGSVSCGLSKAAADDSCNALV